MISFSLRGKAAAVALCLAAAFSVPGSAAQRAESSARPEIERLIRESGADVAVAFRTLDGKQELFIRADDSFHAASTMKIAVMIELFRQAGEGKLRLDDPLPVRNEFRSIADGSPYQLDPADDSDTQVYRSIGQTMTLRQLCDAMITVSSNLAANLLIDRLGVENIRRTIHRLGADGLDFRRGVEDQRAYEAGISNTTTARALMILLERLSRGKAVSAKDDREMLAILKRQQLNEAIPAGLPVGTPVAHKTGTITRIHHDAAIVYAPRPFVLVILVRGIADEKQSAALMAEITRVLYGSLHS